MFNPALKAELLRKGQDVAAALEQLMSGKEVDLAALLPPGMSKDEVRLREFLGQIDRAIKCFDTGDYGRCRVCGDFIAPDALRERPWLDRCAKHSR
jgi:RNA polymerase-binding transcription factor DksA